MTRSAFSTMRRILLRISQQHGMAFYAAIARVYLSWARGRLGDARNGAEELRHSLADYSEYEAIGRLTPAYLGLLAEPEAAAGDADLALTHINEGLVGWARDRTANGGRLPVSPARRHSAQAQSR